MLMPSALEPFATSYSEVYYPLCRKWFKLISHQLPQVPVVPVPWDLMNTNSALGLSPFWFCNLLAYFSSFFFSEMKSYYSQHFIICSEDTDLDSHWSFYLPFLSWDIETRTAHSTDNVHSWENDPSSCNLIILLIPTTIFFPFLTAAAVYCTEMSTVCSIPEFSITQRWYSHKIFTLKLTKYLFPYSLHVVRFIWSHVSWARLITC